MGIPVFDVWGYVFTFHPMNQPEEEFTIASEMLAEWAKVADVEVTWAKIDRGLAEFVLNNNGIEEHRVARLTPECLNEPVVFLITDDNMHVLCDGNHRLVYAAINGARRIKARFIPPEQWKPFIVDGMPKIGDAALRTMHSGIK